MGSLIHKSRASLHFPSTRFPSPRSAVFLGAGLVYYLRLPEEFRTRLSEELWVITGRHHTGPMSLKDTMDLETRLYISNVKLESGIAQNNALKVQGTCYCSFVFSLAIAFIAPNHPRSPLAVLVACRYSAPLSFSSRRRTCSRSLRASSCACR